MKAKRTLKTILFSISGIITIGWTTAARVEAANVGFGCDNNPSCSSYVGLRAFRLSSYSRHTPSFEVLSHNYNLDPYLRDGRLILSESLEAVQAGINYNSSSSASLSARGGPGSLGFSATSEAGGNVSARPNSVESGSDAYVSLEWGDTIEILSNTIAPGSYAQFQLALDFSRSLGSTGFTPQNQAYASASLQVSGVGAINIFDSANDPNPESNVSREISLQVGEQYVIGGGLSGGTISSASAWINQPSNGNYSFVRALNTANYFLTPMTDEANYSTASGNYYGRSSTTAVPTPALLPGLIGMGAAAIRKRKQKAQAEA